VPVHCPKGKLRQQSEGIVQGNTGEEVEGVGDDSPARFGTLLDSLISLGQNIIYHTSKPVLDSLLLGMGSGESLAAILAAIELEVHPCIFREPQEEEVGTEI